MNYQEISKETITYLYQSYASLNSSSLEPSLRILIELRTSQINGCEYCCKLHTEEAKKCNIPSEKIDSLNAWNTSSYFNIKEKAALKWCEDLTILNKKSIDELKHEIRQYFSDREIVDLTACVSIMNALNRLTISLKSSS